MTRNDSQNTISLSNFQSTQFGTYHLLRRLAIGGMSEVYLAFDIRSNKTVALKILAEALAHDPAYVRRFIREAQLGQFLSHPNLVSCLDFGRHEASGRHFMALEYVAGLDTQTWLDRNGRLPLGDALRIVGDIAQALVYLHDAGLVHRDVKPGNILVTSDGQAKLADLGLTRRLDPSTAPTTQLPQTVGTPHYMPYEQFLNAVAVDERSDLYALGVTLYHLICASLPFEGDSAEEIAQKKLKGTFLAASRLVPEVPQELDFLLARLLSPEPASRPASARELVRYIHEIGCAITDGGCWTKSVGAVLDGSSSSTAPTRLNLPNINAPSAETVPTLKAHETTESEVVAAEKEWVMRVKAKTGGSRVVRLTTKQLTRVFRAKQLGPNTLIERLDGTVKPASKYPQLAELFPESPHCEAAPPCVAIAIASGLALLLAIALLVVLVRMFPH